VEEGHAQGLLQLLYLYGYGGLAYIQGIRCPGETAIAGHGVEDAELMEVEVVDGSLP